MPMQSGMNPTGFENVSRPPGASSANGIRNATIPGRARKATMAFGSSAFIGSASAHVALTTTFHRRSAPRPVESALHQLLLLCGQPSLCCSACSMRVSGTNQMIAAQA